MKFDDSLTRDVFSDLMLADARLVECIDLDDMAWYGGWVPAKSWGETLGIEVMGTHNSDPARSIFKANLEVIKKEFDFDKTGLVEAFGGHGTHALIWVPQENNWVEFLGLVNGLAHYPALDDAALALQEAEDQREAFDDWLANDFERRLANRIKDQWCTAGIGDDIDLWQVFCTAMSEVGAEWVSDSDGWIVAGLDKIVAAVPDPAALFDKEPWLDN